MHHKTRTLGKKILAALALLVLAFTVMIVSAPSLDKDRQAQFHKVHDLLADGMEGEPFLKLKPRDTYASLLFADDNRQVAIVESTTKKGTASLAEQRRALETKQDPSISAEMFLNPRFLQDGMLDAVQYFSTVEGNEAFVWRFTYFDEGAKVLIEKQRQLD